MRQPPSPRAILQCDLNTCATPVVGPADFLLNSLTSPAMVAASLACLRLRGRMAEISKRDIWCPQRVAQERPDVAYQLVAIDFLPPSVSVSCHKQGAFPWQSVHGKHVCMLSSTPCTLHEPLRDHIGRP